MASKYVRAVEWCEEYIPGFIWFPIVMTGVALTFFVVMVVPKFILKRIGFVDD